MSLPQAKNRRLFTPVILFNDHTPGAGRRNNDGGHYSVSPERASPGGSLMEHKKRIDEMLEANGKFWADVTASYLQGSGKKDGYPTGSTNASGGDNTAEGTSSSTEGDPPAGTGAKNKTQTKDKKKRPRANIPKEVIAILMQWLEDHKENPYPTDFQKDELVKITGLQRSQVSNWFINARRRIWRPVILGHNTSSKARNASEAEEEDELADEDKPDSPAAPKYLNQKADLARLAPNMKSLDQALMPPPAPVRRGRGRPRKYIRID